MNEMYCIVCPNGCRLAIEEIPEAATNLSPTEHYRVTGNRCERGISFAIAETIHPTRSVTTTVRTDFPGAPVLPVRSATEIPKARISELMQFLGELRVTKALGIGEVVAKNPLGLETDIIATGNILRECAAEGGGAAEEIAAVGAGSAAEKSAAMGAKIAVVGPAGAAAEGGGAAEGGARREGAAP
ncbi:MAG: DUF1667 domain-containing protein [Treponema sp.]|jgi:CxxC motif-containing protein|nr:DUF1667 domain-containing protein [Treponema sp.]